MDRLRVLIKVHDKFFTYFKKVKKTANFFKVILNYYYILGSKNGKNRPKRSYFDFNFKVIIPLFHQL